jgi:hypothetical protein
MAPRRSRKTLEIIYYKYKGHQDRDYQYNEVNRRFNRLAYFTSFTARAVRTNYIYRFRRRKFLP